MPEVNPGAAASGRVRLDRSGEHLDNVYAWGGDEAGLRQTQRKYARRFAGRTRGLGLVVREAAPDPDTAVRLGPKDRAVAWVRKIFLGPVLHDFLYGPGAHFMVADRPER